MQGSTTPLRSTQHTVYLISPRSCPLFFFFARLRFFFFFITAVLGYPDRGMVRQWQGQGLCRRKVARTSQRLRKEQTRGGTTTSSKKAKREEKIPACGASRHPTTGERAGKRAKRGRHSGPWRLPANHSARTPRQPLARSHPRAESASHKC